MIDTPRIWRKPGGEDEQPDQRPHQGGDEALALMHEAQRFAPRDAAQADQVLAERKAALASSIRPALIPVSPGRAAGQRGEALRMSAAPAAPMTSAHVAGRQHAAHDAAPPPRRPAATSSSRCVAHSTATPRSRTSPRTWRRIADARGDVQPDGRLVQHQHARPMQQGARDLDPPHLAARQLARRVPRAIRQLDLLQRGLRAPPRLAAADAVQRGVIEQVLHHREVEIERARLEHHAEQAQCLHPARATRDGRARRSSPAACRRAG